MKTMEGSEGTRLQGVQPFGRVTNDTHSGARRKQHASKTALPSNWSVRWPYECKSLKQWGNIENGAFYMDVCFVHDGASCFFVGCVFFLWNEQLRLIKLKHWRCVGRFAVDPLEVRTRLPGGRGLDGMAKEGEAAGKSSLGTFPACRSSGQGRETKQANGHFKGRQKRGQRLHVNLWVLPQRGSAKTNTPGVTSKEGTSEPIWRRGLQEDKPKEGQH